MLKSGSYLTIQSWMVNDLQLKGLDLLVYAVIYMFSQDGQSMFNGSVAYLQDWTNSSRRAVVYSLRSLEDRGLISRSSYVVEGVTRYGYSVNHELAFCYSYLDYRSGLEQGLHGNERLKGD